MLLYPWIPMSITTMTNEVVNKSLMIPTSRHRDALKFNRMEIENSIEFPYGGFVARSIAFAVGAISGIHKVVSL
jgi:hypothetical protein